MQLIFTPDSSGTARATGYATVSYSSSAENETVVETTKDGLTSIFENAKKAGENFDGTDATVDGAINGPLSFLDYLVLVEGNVEFNSEYVRE